MAVIGGTVLSLVLGDRSAVVAQVVLDKGRRVVQRVGRFDTPADTRLLDKPADHGKALAAYLAGHGFAAKKAVVGVPAKWLIAQERDLPPVDAGGAADLLRLAAERLSLAESGTLVADYAGTPDRSNASRVLLVGMLKPQLDRIRQFVEAAGLSLAAACPTSLAVASLAGGDRSVLRLGDDGAELVLQSGGSPRALQSLASDPHALAADLRRTLTMRGVAANELVLCDGVGLSPEQSAELSSRLAAPPQRFGDNLGVTVDASARNGSAASLPADAHWAAVALAVAASAKPGLPADFTDSKLAVKPPARFGRRTVLAVMAGVLAVGLFAWLVMTVQDREAEAESLTKQVADRQKPVKDARVLTDQINYGRTYFDQRPPVLDLIKQFALLSNYGERIWLTNLTLSPSGRGAVNGKAEDPRGDQKLILSLRDRMKADPNFRDVGGLQTNASTAGRDPVKSFTINFFFSPAPATSPATAPSRK